MSYPLFVPRTRQRVQEEALDRYGVELTDWMLDRVMDELDYWRPQVEIELMRRAIDHQMAQTDDNQGIS